MSTIGDRIREFGEEKFGKRGMNKFAEALDMMPQALHVYLKGDRTPGHKIQQKLRELGADVEYIMTGVKKMDKFYQHIGSINQGSGGQNMAGFTTDKIEVNKSDKTPEDKDDKLLSLTLENMALRNTRRELESTNAALNNTIKDKERIIHELEQRILLLERLANLQK